MFHYLCFNTFNSYVKKKRLELYAKGSMPM